MSREAQNWVWDEAPVDDPRDMLILLSLADVADAQGGSAFPSVARLARDCRSDARTVQRHLSGMVKAGVLEIEKKASQHRPTTYRIAPLFTRGDNLSLLEIRGDTQGRLRGDTGVTNDDSALLYRTGSGITPAEEKPKRKRPRDGVFEAVAEVCRIDWHQATKTELVLIGSVASELKALGATEEDVLVTGQKMIAAWPHLDLGPRGLARNWSTFSGVGVKISRTPEQEDLLWTAATVYDDYDSRGDGTWLDADGVTHEGDPGLEQVFRPMHPDGGRLASDGRSYTLTNQMERRYKQGGVLLTRQNKPVRVHSP